MFTYFLSLSHSTSQCLFQVEWVGIEVVEVNLVVIHHDLLGDGNTCHHQMTFNLSPVRLLDQLY